MLGESGLLLDERLVDQQLRRSRRQLLQPPRIDLLLQRAEVSLHAIYADGQAVLQREVLGMLRQDGSVRARDNVSNSVSLGIDVPEMSLLASTALRCSTSGLLVIQGRRVIDSSKRAVTTDVQVRRAYFVRKRLFG